MLREREQLKLGETMSRISKWHCGVFIIIINGRKPCSSYKQLYPKLRIANINLTCLFVCGGEELTARKASFPLRNWKFLIYLVLSWSGFCGGLLLQDGGNLHTGDSGAVNLHPSRRRMTTPNCFAALRQANCDSSRNGVPLSPARRRSPAEGTWLRRGMQPAPSTLSSEEPELCASSMELLHQSYLSIEVLSGPSTLSLKAVGPFSCSCLNVVVVEP